MLRKLIDGIKTKQGFVTAEIPDPNIPGQRLGFELIAATGGKTTLAHVNSQSSTRVSRYGVDVEALNTFIEPLKNFTSSQLLYIDEVGEMELYSDSFRQLVKLYLRSPNHFIGTVSNQVSDPLIGWIIKDPSISLYDITPANRDLLFSQLQNDLMRNISLDAS